MQKSRLIMIIGVALAAVAMILVIVLLGGKQAPGPEVPTKTTVVVAAQDIEPGTEIRANMVTTKEVPKDAARDTYADPSQVVGKTIRSRVAKDAELKSSHFSGGGQADIAADIPKGKRAMAITTDEVSGVAGMIQQGDSVDILINWNTMDKDPKKDQAPFMTVKTVLQNIQVLRVNKTETTSSSPGTQAAPGQTMILALDDQEAEILKFGIDDGLVTLVLRPTGDKDAQTTSGITLKKLIDSYGLLSPPYTWLNPPPQK